MNNTSYQQQHPTTQTNQQQQQWPTFDCTKCASKFYFQEDLNNHFYSCNPLPCSACEIVVVNEELFRWHFLQEHGNNSFNNYNTSSYQEEEQDEQQVVPDQSMEYTAEKMDATDAAEPNDSTKKFFCMKCNKGFQTNWYWKRHLKTLTHRKLHGDEDSTTEEVEYIQPA